MSKTTNTTAQLQTDNETGIVIARTAHAPGVEALKDGLLDAKAIEKAQVELGNFDDRISHLNSMSTVFDDDAEDGPITMNVAPKADTAVTEALEMGEAPEEDVVIGGIDDPDLDDDLLGDVFAGEDDLMAPFADDVISGAVDDAVSGDDVPDFNPLPDEDLARNREVSDAVQADAEALSSEDDSLEYLEDGDLEMAEGDEADMEGDGAAETDTVDPVAEKTIQVAPAEETENADQSLASLIGHSGVAGKNEPEDDVGALLLRGDGEANAAPEAFDEAIGTSGPVDVTDIDTQQEDGIEESTSSFDAMPVPDWASTDDGTSIPGSEYGQDPDGVPAGDDLAGSEDIDADLEPWSFDAEKSDDPAEAAPVANSGDFSEVEVFKMPEEDENPNYATAVADYRDEHADPSPEEGDAGVSEDAKFDLEDQSRPDAPDDELGWLDADETDDMIEGDAPTDTLPEGEGETPDAQPASKRKGRVALLAAAAAFVSIAVGGGYALLQREIATKPVSASLVANAPSPMAAPIPAPAPQMAAPGLTAPSDDTPPVTADDILNPIDEVVINPMADATNGITDVDIAQFIDPAGPVPEQADLSEFKMDDIPAPAAIEGDQSPADASALGLAELTSELESAADGDIDSLFLDEGEDKAADPEPSITAEQLEGFAKKEEITELRAAIDLMFEKVGVLNDEVVERDQVIVDLQAKLEAAQAKAQRAETLALGQNEVLAEFLRVKEKIDMAESLIVDLSRRIAAVETTDPADRVAVERSIEDLNGRLEGMARDLGLIARIAINGSPEKLGTSKRTGASEIPGAGQVFQTAPSSAPAPGDKARIPSDVKAGDFVEGYGAVLQVMPTAGGGRLVVMENKSVLIP